MSRRARFLLVVALAGSAMASGCAWAPVGPAERESLAQPVMQRDGHALGVALEWHRYASKESTAGGYGLAGGGCGCN